MTTLKQARDSGTLDQFIADREASPDPTDGDKAAFNRTLKAMAGMSKAAPGALKPRRSDD